MNPSTLSMVGCAAASARTGATLGTCGTPAVIAGSSLRGRGVYERGLFPGLGGRTAALGWANLAGVVGRVNGLRSPVFWGPEGVIFEFLEDPLLDTVGW